MDTPAKKKVLIADASSITIRHIFNSEKSSNYDIQTVESGEGCIKAIETFKPDLVLVELLLPHVHGIEILKQIKENDKTKHIGVIITTSLAMAQNYNASIELGAEYFLSKPFSADELFHLFERFFEDSLHPDPFSPKLPHYEGSSCYNPVPSTVSKYIKFWGTRGSNPVSGSEYIQFGGNTSCLEIKYDDTFIVIDAGSGIRELGDHTSIKEGQNIPLFIGHTHWDHISGFPFFMPLYHKGVQIDVYSPVGYEKNTKELFTDILSHGYFPIRLEEMIAKINFLDLRDGSSFQIGDLKISCHHAHHPGPTLCFKIESPKQTIGYITDNEVLLGYHGSPSSIGKQHSLLEPHLSFLSFFSDCHVIIHEAQYFPGEYHAKVGWGHSSLSNAIAILKHLNCKEWIVTHHDPAHTDKDLELKTRLHEDIMSECNVDVKFKMAYDGLVVPL